MAALGDTTASLKGCAIVPSCSTNHDGITPVATDKPNHLGSCSIAFQQHDALLPIHCIEGLPKIKEDTIKWLELEVQELLSQFNFDDRSASPAFAATAMEAVVQLDGIQLVIDHPLDALPNGPQKPNPTVTPPPLLESKQRWTKEVSMGSRHGSTLSEPIEQRGANYSLRLQPLGLLGPPPIAHHGATP